MEQKFEGIFAELVARGKLVERVLSGETADSIPEGLEGAFSGVVFDENTDAVLETEHLRLLLERQMGSTLEQAVDVATLESVDKQTRVMIFGVALGVDKNYYLSRWQNDGEKPSYILWPKEMYDFQLAGDDETEASFSLSEGEWE